MMTRFYRLAGLVGRSSSFILAISVAMTGARTSVADSVSFDPTGLGGAGVKVSTFDETPGNAVAVNGQAAIDAALTKLAGMPAGSSVTSDAFTVYYQANVNLIDPTGKTLSTTQQFTAVAAFQETATVFNSGSTNTVTFSLAANQSGSYLDFFAQTSGNIGNNSTGVGFATDQPGAVLIYSGTVPTSGSSGQFTNNGGSSPLGPGSSQQSVSGTGSTSFSVGTNYFNTNYFTSSPGPLLSFTSTNKLTFLEAPPSSSFVRLQQSGTNVTLLTPYKPSLGTVNGSVTNGGPDVQFQADASSSFVAPEPASLAMTALGLGAAGLGTFFSRRRAKAQAIVA